MSSPIALPYEQVLKRGRVTLLVIIFFVVLSGASIAVATTLWLGWHHIWRLLFFGLLSLMLLWAMYYGNWLAQRVVILGLVISIGLLLFAAFHTTELPIWVRLAASVIAGVNGGLAVVLMRFRPISEFMTRGMLRQMAADRILNKDGIRLFNGKKLEEWLLLAKSIVVAEREEAVQGLKCVLQDLENAECERALLGLSKDPDESVRYDAVSAIRHNQLIRREKGLAIEVMREIRAMPLPDGAELWLTAEDPDTVLEYFEHDEARLEAVALKCHMFTNAGEILKNLGVSPDSV